MSEHSDFIVHQPDTDPWMDEFMNVGLLALAIKMTPVCVYFCDANSLLLSPVPKPFTVGGTLGCSYYVSVSVLLKGHQVPLSSKCHCRIRTD